MSRKSELIGYYEKTHNSRVYGTSSVKYLRFLRPEIKVLRPASILDYGCGQSLFLDCLELGDEVSLHRYDPAIAEYSKLPDEKADLLVCIDVLEHVEEADLDATLEEMASVCRQALIIVDTKPAKHTLPDGRNAHVNLHPHDWWEKRLGNYFGPLQRVITARRSRAAFRTWERGPAATMHFHTLRLAEDGLHYARRLTGRHKSHWKVSARDRGGA